MSFYQVFIYSLAFVVLIDPSSQDKVSVSHRPRAAASAKKTSQSKSVKVPKLKLDLKMDDSSSSLNFQNLPSRLGNRDDGRDWMRKPRTISNIGSNWYGFENYVPRKGRSSSTSSRSSTSSPVSLGTTVRKSYVIGEGYMNGNDHSSNQVAMRYHRQTEPQLDFNLVIPQLEIDAHYRPKMQEERQVYGNVGNAFTSEKSEFPSYYQPNYSPVRRAPIPVIIKIIPLKLSSSYLKEALKNMPFIPLPMSIFNVLRDSMGYGGMEVPIINNNRGTVYRNEGYTVRYDDSMSDMEVAREPETLPRPSSHVATPLDMPPSTSLAKGNLGVTYVEDDSPRYEYDSRFRKRTAKT